MTKNVSSFEGTTLGFHRNEMVVFTSYLHKIIEGVVVYAPQEFWDKADKHPLVIKRYNELKEKGEIE